MINVDNLDFAEEQLRDYQQDPASVDPAWRGYFEQMGINGQKMAMGPSYESSTIFNPPVSKEGDAYKQERVDQLIRAYRVRGHRTAWLDPLGSEPAPFPELQLSHYGLTKPICRCASGPFRWA